MYADYRTAADGTELTLSTHVVAPFRLSLLLSPLLFATPLPVIVTVSSGGMYTQRFDLDDLELTPDDYRGVTAYARAKRAQVVLAHEWDRRWRPEGVASYAMHPGWVRTPGLTASLPAIARLGPLLRTPCEGADTAAWLAAGGRRGAASPDEDRPDRREPGGIWLDRRRRREYYVPTTYRTARRSPTRRGSALGVVHGTNGVGRMTTRAVVWFRRDLRLHDNPAWASASEAADRVTALYVLDPDASPGRRGIPADATVRASPRARREPAATSADVSWCARGAPEKIVPEVAAARGADPGLRQRRCDSLRPTPGRCRQGPSGVGISAMVGQPGPPSRHRRHGERADLTGLHPVRRKMGSIAPAGLARGRAGGHRR